MITMSPEMMNTNGYKWSTRGTLGAPTGSPVDEEHLCLSWGKHIQLSFNHPVFDRYWKPTNIPLILTTSRATPVAGRDMEDTTLYATQTPAPTLSFFSSPKSSIPFSNLN